MQKDKKFRNISNFKIAFILSKNSKTFENKFDEFVMMMADSEKSLQEDKVIEENKKY